MPTIADAYGPEVADELAKWAIDTLCHGELPVRGNAYAGKVPWSVLNAGRAIMESAGIDWRELHKEQRQLMREAHARFDAERRRRLLAERDNDNTR